MPGASSPATATAEAIQAAITQQASDIAYFSSIPWCSSILNDPEYSHVLAPSRVSKGGEADNLAAENFKTKDTMPRWITMVGRTGRFIKEKSIPGVAVATALEGMVVKGGEGLGGGKWIPPRPPRVGENGEEEDLCTIDITKTIVQLGKMVNGWPGIAHGGGVSSFLMDECAANLLRLRGGFDLDPNLVGNGAVTVGLEVGLMGAVPAPGVVLVTMRLREIKDGRKYVFDGTIDAGDGKVLSKAVLTFVAFKGKAKL